MGDLRMAKADMHVTRAIAQRERETIVAALALWLHLSAVDIPEEIRVNHLSALGALSDGEVEGLITELTYARKVKVCRTKTPQP